MGTSKQSLMGPCPTDTQKELAHQVVCLACWPSVPHSPAGKGANEVLIIKGRAVDGKTGQWQYAGSVREQSSHKQRTG